MINVTFHILSDPVPLILLMKDMIEKILDISIMERVIKHKGRTQNLAFENYLLAHRWIISDTPFDLYTYKEL